MRTRSVTALLAAVASMVALPSAAGSLETGARIRWVPGLESGAPRIGRAVGWSSDTLLALDERDSSSHRMALSSLSLLEVSRGRPNCAGRYALIGGVTGGLTGLAVAALVDWATAESVGELLGPDATSQSMAYGPYFLAGAGIGAAIGGLVGVARHGPERWEPVDPASIRLGLASGAPALCLTVRY